MDTPSRALKVQVVTPERAVLDETVDFVALPLYDGELGVLPGRAPLIGRLGYGELRTRKGDVVQRFFVDGGFVQVRNNVVTVLTSRAIKAEDINPSLVTQALQSATAPAADADTQLKNQQRARAQLRIVRKVRGEE